jgi:hypothetical protein
MKKTIVLIAALLCGGVWLFAQPVREMRFERLKKELKNPSSAYRSAPLWVWNTQMSRADIDRTLQELKEQGFGGAFVHPRPGLITEYLSAEWFALFRYSVEKGKKLGMNIWIYDENSYPSGFAGGHVPAEMPESYNQGQGLIPGAAESLPENAGDYFLCLKREGETFTDITPFVNDYAGQKGEYVLYRKSYYGKSKWHGGYSYVDLLYPGVTQKFIEVTMSGYEKELGKELGPVVKGVFTDEPNIATPGGLRWTPDLFAVFEKKWGYDLKTALPLLGEETGNWKQVRHNYMETLLQLFVDRWSKPWHAYTEAKRLQWTGHYWEHGWPNMNDGPDNMAMYAWHQMPAIDMLFNQFNDGHPQAQFGNIRAVKELRSAANQTGATRTLSETYGGGGWDVTFEDLKRLGDWEYVLGVNFMNQHLSHTTITGARKYDYPPVFTSLSPWWTDYKYQNDYFARLSLLLSQGEQLNDILLLEPTTTVWLYYSHIKGHPHAMTVGADFQRFVTRLEKAQVEYDLGSENIIKDRGKVRNGKFVVGKRAYGKVVIPFLVENIDAASFELLKKFVREGGQLIAFSTPTLVNGKESADMADFFRENASRIITKTELNDEVIRELFSNDKITFRQIAGNDLYHQRRTYNDGELLFLVNSSLTETAKGSLSVQGSRLLELDGTTGEIFAFPSRQNGRYAEAEFELPPAGSLLLFSASSGSGEYSPKPGIAGKTEVKADSPLAIERLKENVHTVDFCDLLIDGKAERNLYSVEARVKLYRHFGLDDPWNSAIQYRLKDVEKDTFKTGNIQVQYHFIAVGDAAKFNAKLVAEQPGLWNVAVNGQAVAAVPEEYWLDSRFGVYDIGKAVKEGVNTVELSVSPMSIYAEVSPVYILGDFSLEAAPVGWILRNPVGRLALGSWKEQGHPYYSWDVSYSKNYTVENGSARYSLKLNKWKGTVAEVFVNGEKAGIIAYKPYEFDLTPRLKKGSNTIEVRVVGSLKNLMGPHYNRDRGINGPWHWNGVQKQAPGRDYDLFEYGLLEDFSVFKE